MQAAHHSVARRQRGFTLLEALITLVIVSVGLLGLLALQTASLVNTRVSAARTQATLATESMADRMRANRDGVAANEYHDFDHPSEDTLSTRCTGNEDCDSEQMARFDTWHWDRSLGQQLPNGEGAIECLETDGSACLRYRVTVRWTEPDIRPDSETREPVIRRFDTVVRP